jgi:hypothetical protein
LWSTMSPRYSSKLWKSILWAIFQICGIYTYSQ